MNLRHGGRGYTKSHGKQRHNKSKTLPRATLILDRARFKPTNHLTRQDSFLSLKAETDHHSAAIIRCTRTSALQAKHPKPRLSLSQRGAALESCCVFVCCKSHAWSLCWKRTYCWWKKICTKWVKVTVMSLGEFSLPYHLLPGRHDSLRNVLKSPSWLQGNSRKIVSHKKKSLLPVPADWVEWCKQMTVWNIS